MHAHVCITLVNLTFDVKMRFKDVFLNPHGLTDLHSNNPNTGEGCYNRPAPLGWRW